MGSHPQAVGNGPKWSSGNKQQKETLVVSMNQRISIHINVKLQMHWEILRNLRWFWCAFGETFQQNLFIRSEYLLINRTVDDFRWHANCTKHTEQLQNLI
jgi:hypothetical protein